MTRRLHAIADALRSSSGKDPAPRNFIIYVALVAAAAAASLVVLPWVREWRVGDPALLVVLSAFVLAGELLPIPVPRRRGLTRVTISAAFALAILLRFGPGPAVLIYVASSVIADVAGRVSPLKTLFNAAQYVLAMVAAAVVLRLAGDLPLGAITGGELPIVLAAGTAFFATNHVLACAAGALLARLPIVGYLRDDLAFQGWTAGCVLAFAPALLASADASVALVPVCFVPMLAVYFGGRQASISSHRAHHDALTGLPNRSSLSETLQEALGGAASEPHPVAVMLLDIDDFKSINDTLGHELGDLVIQRVARRLRQAAGDGARSGGKETVLARIGGDEFAVLVHGAEPQAEEVAERLLAALDHPLEVDSVALHICASIGIACFPKHGRSAPELMRHADVALYCAKGSDAGFATYAEEDDEYSIDRLALAAQLRRGIERGELVVHYQPKVPLQGGTTLALEALVRWNHPQLGCIGPDGFIPLAEQTGIIRPLTERVLEASLEQCRRWRQQGLEVTVSVNVSTRSLLDHDLPVVIRALLARLNLDASALQLEITETRIVADLPRARAALDELRAMGVKIAIDDFGTGYSSLSQLQQLPVDEIKIDRSFVTRMETDRQDAVLVHSIIDLGRNLGLRVTAEGVETENVKQVLARLGCDYAQGFHVGRPVVAGECARYLDSEATNAPATPSAAVVSLTAVR
ncbi:MAG TPA: EAL domain-containing protein [Solirubrobacteraceae bacterium]|nr:EAL domain-containing protein [Solirubrobacteraceae bacterium]